MRLLNISLPSSQYIFSNEYQNTKLKVFVSLRSGGSGDIIIAIDEGSYTPDQLATEIETKLNKAVASSTIPLVTSGYNNFRCKYNSVSNTFWFGNLVDKFVLKL